MKRCLVLNLYLVVASGCATNFTGSAKIDGGRPGCEQKCSSVGLQMQAFVFMGEYSTACICDAPGRTGHAGGAAAPAAAGAITQMRDTHDEFCDRDDCGRFGD